MRAAVDIIGLSGFDNAVEFKQSRLPYLDRRAYRIAQGFDSAAVLLRDGEVDFAIAEERITREKATGAFPAGSSGRALRMGLHPAGVDRVAHCFRYEPHEPRSCVETARSTAISSPRFTTHTPLTRTHSS